MLKWLINLFVGEKGVASTPESVTPVHPTVSQEEVDKINQQTQKIAEDATQAQELKPVPEPKQEWKDWPKSEKSGIKKKPAAKPQSTAVTKSRAVKAKATTKTKAKTV